MTQYGEMSKMDIFELLIPTRNCQNLYYKHEPLGQ